MNKRKNENASRGTTGVDVAGMGVLAAFGAAQQANHTAAIAESTVADVLAIKSRSTSTESQLAKLPALLRRGPQTTHSLRMQGISHPAGRVNDLRKAGFVIATQRVKSLDSDGFTHINTARYVLISEPPRQMDLPEVAA